MKQENLTRTVAFKRVAFPMLITLNYEEVTCGTCWGHGVINGGQPCPNALCVGGRVCIG
jgi:hypothetical protein